MKQFGSLKRLRAATVEELVAVPGIGRRTAEAVLAAVAQPEVGEAAEVQPEVGEAAETQPEVGEAAETQPEDGAAQPEDGSAAPAEETVETTTAPAGPAERGTPRSGSGATAEVGLVAS
jgi:excinuclease ABC subunit C